MQVVRRFVVVLLLCVLSVPVLGCGGSPQAPKKADPADDVSDPSKLSDVLPPPDGGKKK